MIYDYSRHSYSIDNNNGIIRILPFNVSHIVPCVLCPWTLMNNSATKIQKLYRLFTAKKFAKRASDIFVFKVRVYKRENEAGTKIALFIQSRFRMKQAITTVGSRKAELYLSALFYRNEHKFMSGTSSFEDYWKHLVCYMLPEYFFQNEQYTSFIHKNYRFIMKRKASIETMFLMVSTKVGECDLMMFNGNYFPVPIYNEKKKQFAWQRMTFYGIVVNFDAKYTSEERCEIKKSDTFNNAFFAWASCDCSDAMATNGLCNRILRNGLFEYQLTRIHKHRNIQGEACKCRQKFWDVQLALPQPEGSRFPYEKFLNKFFSLY